MTYDPAPHSSLGESKTLSQKNKQKQKNPTIKLPHVVGPLNILNQVDACFVLISCSYSLLLTREHIPLRKIDLLKKVPRLGREMAANQLSQLNFYV